MENLGKKQILWTRHANREALEDEFSLASVENGLKNCFVMETGLGKEKAVCEANSRYCTVIFVRFKSGIKIITCWKSSNWEIRAFEDEFKEGKK